MRLALLLLLVGCSVDLKNPRPIRYDSEVCDECAMMISEPRFAAQIVTTEGKVSSFDDPACAFRYIADEGPSIGNMWFVDSTDTTQWLDWKTVGFVPATGAPMDGGLGAVPIGTEGAISFSEASGRFLRGGK